jgi:hypothetical protein
MIAYPDNPRGRAAQLVVVLLLASERDAVH